jgi:hypothetical protein
LAYWAKQTIEAMPTVSHRTASKIVGKGGRKKSLMIDSGIKNQSARNNATIRINTQALFEKIAGMPASELRPILKRDEPDNKYDYSIFL